MAFAHAIGSYPYWCGYVSMRTGSNTKRYPQTQAPNASPKRYQQTLPLMGATRPASGIKAKALTDRRVISAACEPLLGVWTFAFMPDAGRVAPIRGSVWGFYHTTTTYTPSILHLTQTRCNSLTINALLSVRYYKFNLHATYTPYILPHGTNTRGRYHGIGEQKRLLLRQIVLRPCGVTPAAYVQTDCATAGWCV